MCKRIFVFAAVIPLVCGQVQVHDEVALIREGKVTHVLDGQASAGVFPALERVSPLAVLNNNPDTLTLHGANLAHTDNIVLGYCQGACEEKKVVG